MRKLSLILILWVVLAEASDLKVESYIEEAKRLNQGVASSINESKIKEVVADYGKDPKEKNYAESELRSKAERMLLSSKRRSEDPNISASERSEARAAAIITESKNARHNFDKINQEKWMQKSDMVTENPLVGVKSACKLSGEVKDDITVVGEPYEVEVKDMVEIEEEKLCEEDSTEVHKCEDVLELKCKRTDECARGGIVITSIATDMEWEHHNMVFTLGNRGNDYWGIRGECKKYYRSTKFAVKDKDLIEEFRLIKVGYDDYMRVTLNGVQIYIGPEAGDRLEVEHYGVITGITETIKVHNRRRAIEEKSKVKRNTTM